MRLFIALEAPPAWQQAASEAQRALQEALPLPARDLLRMVDPALMHLTLCFLGEIEDAALAPLQASLAEQVRSVDLVLSLGAVGTFGPPQRTSVAWLGIEDDVEGLRALAAKVDEAVRVAGLAGDGRPFAPHLTLARVRRQAERPDRAVIARAAEELAPLSAEMTRARMREVALVCSHLGASQPRYEVLGRYG